MFEISKADIPLIWGEPFCVEAPEASFCAVVVVFFYLDGFKPSFLIAGAYLRKRVLRRLSLKKPSIAAFEYLYATLVRGLGFSFYVSFFLVLSGRLGFF